MELSLRTVLSFAVIVCPVLCVRVIDMTHSLDENSITWPINPRFKLTIMHRGLWGDTGIWVENNKINLAEHTGTHVDAPAHAAKGNWRIHNIPLERLMGPGVIIDVKHKVKDNVDYIVTIDDIKQWEGKHGEIPPGAVVLMNSGWHDKYGDYKRAFNSQNVSDGNPYHFPGWHEDTAKWLIDKRDINILGGDTPSFDVGESNYFPVHKVLLSANKCGVENVAYLDRVPESGSMIYLTVIKIKDGSGAPVRMFAIVDSAHRTAPCVALLICVAIFLSVFNKY